jgi:glyoxylase-like metal-dependent hydrolase (beta-lactamase superfamily II)
MLGLKGSVVVTERAGVRIHSYVSPEDGWLVNSQIIEGQTRLIIFDAQLVNAYAEEVVAYARHLGKPVDRIVVSHAHPDHWAGLEILSARFPEAPVYALEGVIATLRRNGPAMIERLQRLLGPNAASRAAVPTHVLEPGKAVIDGVGVTFEFQEFRDAESDLQLVALLPEQRLILAFDLVFAPHDHLFTVVPHFDHWIGILESLKTIEGYDLLLIGHDKPTDFAAFDATIAYLRQAAQVHAASIDGAGYAAGLKAAFPDRRQAGWVEFSGRRLFPGPTR